MDKGAQQVNPHSLRGRHGIQGWILAPKGMAREANAKDCDRRYEVPPVAAIREEGLTMVSSQQTFKMQLMVAVMLRKINNLFRLNWIM